ncbi:Autophagy-related protein 13 [Acropora cervicornis]|uniref:Autophagy-related protein 13 n=1 Tax=Acropora cervicornis TaxID=6130 RepID=A0AAD9QQX7_ACRCE|nr:Autophagy-related protein 13 [Acropora cervicornis]
MVEMAEKFKNREDQEERDLKKYLKFLSLKAIQVIVQSRLGEKIHTKSKPNSMGQDWFNLAINDDPDVSAEAKKVTSGKLPSQESPMCVEISLKTSEDESMVLETWCLGINDRVDSNTKVTYTFYNRIGMLLKSLVSVTRVTPAYQLSRKQGKDFMMCYKPQIMVTSDHFKSEPARVSCDPLSGVLQCVSGAQGAFDLTAEARHHIAEQIASATETEVTQSSTKSSNTPPSSSHRLSSASPSPPFTRRLLQEKNAIGKQDVEWSASSSKPLNWKQMKSKGAFVSGTDTPVKPFLPNLSSSPPFASLLRRKDDESIGLPSENTLVNSPPGLKRKILRALNLESPADRSDKEMKSLMFQTVNNLVPEYRSDKFASINIIHRRPDTEVLKKSFRLKKSFSAVIWNSLSAEAKLDSSSERTERRPSATPAMPQAPSQLGWDDDFVMVELKPAFASHSGSSTGDLGSFFRECQTAPPLSLFQDTEIATMDNVMDQLDGELCGFRENASKFDELLTDLQQA